MNIDDAIKAHTNWRMKLASYIAKPDHSLKVGTVGSPDVCELGKWLNGDGRKYSNITEFAALVAGHAHFHTVTAELVSKADAGQDVSEEIAVGSKSAFGDASCEVVGLLIRIKTRLCCR